MPNDEGQTFISYAREDSEFALRLAKDLREAGANLWLDQLDIQPGERWDQSVENALANCKSLLVVLSPTAVGSTNVMDEISFALETNKQVIPVLLRACEIPFRLRRVQYIDFTAEYQDGVDLLLRSLGIEKRAVSPSPPPSEPAETSPTPHGPIQVGELDKLPKSNEGAHSTLPIAGATERTRPVEAGPTPPSKGTRKFRLARRAAVGVAAATVLLVAAVFFSPKDNGDQALGIDDSGTTPTDDGGSPTTKEDATGITRAQILSLRPEARYGIPTADQYLLNREYIVGYSYERRQPRWVLELLNDRTLQVEEGLRRMDNFREDLRIPAQFRSTPNDWKGSGYDRGHLATPGNHRQGAIVNSETFLTSNLTPQKPKFNRGIWRLLEVAVRELAAQERYLEVYVISGPLFQVGGRVEFIGDSRVILPDAFFKSVLAEPTHGRLRMWSFVIPNEKTDKEPSDFLVPTEEVSRQAGLPLWDVLSGGDSDDFRKRVRPMWSLPENER